MAQMNQNTENPSGKPGLAAATITGISLYSRQRIGNTGQCEYRV
jgi:hypothetical protein